MKKINFFLWFLLRPIFWTHLFFLILNRFKKRHDTEINSSVAKDWANRNKTSLKSALIKLNLYQEEMEIPQIPTSIINRAKQNIDNKVHMGGGADINLLFAIVIGAKPKRIIETGVAYGWSSLVILSALSNNNIKGKLVSIDMPYPLRNNEKYVGILVPKKEDYRKNWVLIKLPDRSGIKRALNIFNNEIDLCHYDSDKSWHGRAYAYPLLWNALRSGGIFISDDIQDNLFFKEFSESLNIKPIIIKSENKFIGVMRKP